MHLEDIFLSKDSKIVYSLEWKWVNSDNDSQLVSQGLATYTVYVTIQSGFEREIK